MMVGGFSEADVLQNAVQKTFSDIEVFIPVEKNTVYQNCESQDQRVPAVLCHT
jgi:hypothetical protein